MKKWIALIPVYQPTSNLIDLLIDLKSHQFEIVIVDDGSTDGEEIFHYVESFGIVLHHDHNKGKGAAIKTGLYYIQNTYSSNEIVVTVDGDGQHKVNDAIRVCKKAEENDTTIVLGSRHFVGDIPLRSRLGNIITRFVFRFTTGTNVKDTQTGLRAFSIHLIPKLLEMEGDKYEYEMNMLLQSKRNGITIEEVPIETVYIDGNSSSHFHAFRDSFLIYKEIFKYSFVSLLSFLLDYSLFETMILLFGSASSAIVMIANVIARIISGTFNFWLNRNIVFHSEENIARSALQYIVLAASILLGNTLVLTTLITYLGMNPFLAKLMTEVLFFFVSWTVQKHVIFTPQVHRPVSS